MATDSLPHRSCSEPECLDKYVARGYCSKHYQRYLKSGTIPRVHHRSGLTVCAVEGCLLPDYSHGFCNKHYQRWKRHGEVSTTKNLGSGCTPVERFWSRVRITADTTRCWEWVGKLDKNGYGKVTTAGRSWFAHRYAWSLFHGEPNDQILHRCDNPPCVNPDHLFEGTVADNMADRQAKNRQPKGEESGRSKLKEIQVKDIVRLIRRGHSTVELSGIYSVAPRTIRDIKAGKTWRHVVIQ